jgi:hypothetical protein
MGVFYQCPMSSELLNNVPDPSSVPHFVIYTFLDVPSRPDILKEVIELLNNVPHLSQESAICRVQKVSGCKLIAIGPR